MRLTPARQRRLEHVVKPDNVALEDVLPGVLAGNAAEMDDALDPGNHALDLRQVGDVGLVHFLPVARRGDRHPVGQPQHRIDAAQRLAQRAADAAAGAGDQDAMHCSSSEHWPG